MDDIKLFTKNERVFVGLPYGISTSVGYLMPKHVYTYIGIVNT